MSRSTDVSCNLPGQGRVREVQAEYQLTDRLTIIFQGSRNFPVWTCREDHRVVIDESTVRKLFSLASRCKGLGVGETGLLLWEKMALVHQSNDMQSYCRSSTDFTV